MVALHKLPLMLQKTSHAVVHLNKFVGMWRFSKLWVSIY